MVYATNNNLFNLGLGVLLAGELDLPLAVVAHHIRWVDHRRRTSRLHMASFLLKLRSSGLGFLPSLERAAGAGVEESLLAQADLLITVSSAVAKGLRQIAPDSQIEIVGNGLNLSRPVEGNVRFPCEALFVGRLDEGKGIQELLGAWKLVVDREGGTLAVVGGGFLQRHSQMLASKLGMNENVHFYGHVSERKLESLYRSARVFVSLSTVEGWGLAIGEALIRGLPVVAYDIPPLREIWGECGAATLVPMGSLSEAAEAIVRLLSLGDDEYARLQKEAKAFASRYQWEDVRKRELEALSRLVG